MPLYSLGSNACHQLSLPHADDVHSPTRTTLNLPDDEYPIKIVAGSNHTFLLTNMGGLYATGANREGQCFMRNKDVLLGFEKVGGERRWRDCAATWEGGVLVDEGGHVWSCGRIKNHGSLEGKGFEELFGRQGSGEMGAGDVRVAAGVQHFVIFRGHDAVGFGDGKKGQFGTTATTTVTPEGIILPASDLEQVACGKDFTCILSSTGKVSVYTTSTKHNLQAIPALPVSIKSIASSWSTIALLDDTGKIHSWGRNDRSQAPPIELPAIAQLSAGSEHFIALSQDKKVYAWGWNEHGNCGLATLEDVYTVHELKFPQDEVPVYIAAGCGTSWIWTEKKAGLT